jgi:pyruvate/2-oxoglutarate dehydrogenase complex dihydrolipoamide dehydrogenase (E3) component
LSKRYDYDVIILGGGSGGIVSGVVAGSAGLRTLLIEKDRMGGECLHTGCVPSKALIEAADLAHRMRHADRLGLSPCPLNRHDAVGVLRHVRQMVNTVEKADATTALLEKSGVTIRFGNARFVSPDALEFQERDGGTRMLTAEHFILATGSRPARADLPGLEETGYLTNQEVFDLDSIPESLLVVGGGPTGVEMAQAFARLGSAVTLIERGTRLLKRDDPEASALIEETLRAERVTLFTETQVLSARLNGERRILRVRRDGAEADVSGTHILLAVGRRPNVEGLDLEAAGVRYSQRGVEADAALKTTGPRVWACGDVIGRAPFSHMAEYEARLLVQNILFPVRQSTNPGMDLLPWTTFTDPEVARVGLTEEQARARGIRYEVYRQPFGQNDRAIVAGRPRGFVKALTTGPGGRIIGVQIVGPSAGELLQEWISAMRRGASVREIADTIHVYPTLSMASQHAATRWYEAQANKPAVRKALTTYTRTLRPNLGKIALGLAAGVVVGLGALTVRKNAARSGREE